jgi:hypothetical protein
VVAKKVKVEAKSPLINVHVASIITPRLCHVKVQILKNKQQ